MGAVPTKSPADSNRRTARGKYTLAGDIPIGKAAAGAYEDDHRDGDCRPTPDPSPAAPPPGASSSAASWRSGIAYADKLPGLRRSKNRGVGKRTDARRV